MGAGKGGHCLIAGERKVRIKGVALSTLMWLLLLTSSMHHSSIKIYPSVYSIYLYWTLHFLGPVQIDYFFYFFLKYNKEFAPFTSFKNVFSRCSLSYSYNMSL